MLHLRHADPPHGADGRFYSSGDVSAHGDTSPDIRQCAGCGRILSRWSHLFGQRLPTTFAPHVTHGMCLSCHRQSLIRDLLPRLMRIKGLSYHDAKAHIDAMLEQAAVDDAAREAHDAAQRAAYLANHPAPDATSKESRMQALQQRVAALRVQVAQVTQKRRQI